MRKPAIVFHQCDYTPQTPAEHAGLSPGDMFVVLPEHARGSSFTADSILVMVEDDGTVAPPFVLITGDLVTGDPDPDNEYPIRHVLLSRLRRVARIPTVADLDKVPTPCEERGYEIGDEFVFTKHQDSLLPRGTVVILDLDDATRVPRFRRLNGDTCYLDLDDVLKLNYAVGCE
jgi:hypothetical protein